MVNIRDIARLAKVSPATVSLALRGDPRVAAATSKRVHEIARREHYQVNMAASSLRAKRNGVIGLAVYESNGIYAARMAALLIQQAHERGLEAIVQQTSRMSRDDLFAFGQVINRLCDGMILYSSMLSRDATEALDQLHHDKPLVLLDDERSSLHFDTVGFSCEGQAEMAASHLIAIGCRDIVVLGADGTSRADRGDRSNVAQRSRGARQACEEHGVPLDASHFIECEWDYQSAYETLLAALREGRRFDGLLCMNDAMAIGALRALRQMNIDVPGEVAVIGIDGIEETAFSAPSLTTVAAHVEAQAKTAIDLLVERIEHPDDERPARHVNVGYELIVRESTSR